MDCFNLLSLLLTDVSINKLPTCILVPLIRLLSVLKAKSIFDLMAFEISWLILSLSFSDSSFEEISIALIFPLFLELNLINFFKILSKKYILRL